MSNNPPVKLSKIVNLPAPFTQGGLWAHYPTALQTEIILPLSPQTFFQCGNVQGGKVEPVHAIFTGEYEGFG